MHPFAIEHTLFDSNAIGAARLILLCHLSGAYEGAHDILENETPSLSQPPPL